MKYKLLVLLIVASLLGFTRLPETGSFYSDYESSQENFFAASTWPVVSFYPRWDNLYVGFKIQNASPYNLLDFAIDYVHDSLPQHIEGTIDNSAGDDTITREWFIIGGCSGLGEVCWYWEDVTQVDLTVTLHKAGGGSETVTKSITL